MSLSGASGAGDFLSQGVVFVMMKPDEKSLTSPEEPAMQRSAWVGVLRVTVPLLALLVVAVLLLRHESTPIDVVPGTTVASAATTTTATSTSMSTAVGTGPARRPRRCAYVRRIADGAGRYMVWVPRDTAWVLLPAYGGAWALIKPIRRGSDEGVWVWIPDDAEERRFVNETGPSVGAWIYLTPDAPLWCGAGRPGYGALTRTR
ncbi:hypothetical protein Lesp02_03010 [Lentzea sp. NBRC 105346]|uniref:hypothetical protein n=1 Tax=Lentzea sp. NBRC 105346 TaxID=3032205 RepID=UPI0024A56583|nr:hypothetical protein [Lentzea sp. NBRC 105346]GLZ28111.1 hypothetical protein Lesp02_03010 [Lentzea sp. NBRC 105346]